MESPEHLQQGFPFRFELWQSLQTGINPFEVKPEVLHRRLNTLNNLDRYISAHMTAGRNRILREKQLAVFKDTKEFLEQGNHEGFVEAPTGFGKTVLFSEVIRATDQRTVVAVPSRILVEQTYERFKALNPNLDVGRVYSDKKEKGRQVTITTYQSLVLANGGVNPEEIDLLVLDEVHQSLTDSRINAVNRFSNAIKLGFTATPEYTKDKRVENLLNNEIHVITLREAVETGLLSSFSVYLAETNVDISNVKVNQDGEFDDKELEKVIDIYSRNKSALDLYKQLSGQDSQLSKAVAYCVSIKHAKDVARLFNENGVRAEAVWSDQDEKERNDVISAYKRGEVKVLTNVNVLTEGFDDPQASLCLNLRPTLSRVVAKQRGGRVLRLDPDNRNKHAVVVDFVDKDERRRNLQIIFSQVAEGAQISNQVEISTGNDLIQSTAGGKGGSSSESLDLQPQINVEGLNVITNSEEVLRVVRELEQLTYSQTPDGWVSNKTLSKMFNMSEPTVKKLANEFRIDFPNWYKYFLAKRAGIFEYYSPELVVRLTEVINDRFMSPPEGWAHPFQLEDKFNMSGITLKKVANQYRSSHPEWFGTYRSKSGHLVEYVSPQLIDNLLKELKPGRRLSQDLLEEIAPTDFPIIQKKLIQTFVGSYPKLLSVAREVMNGLRNERPEMIATRRSGNLMVTTVTDYDTFVSEMVKNGAVLRRLNTDLDKPKESDFLITNRSLLDIFIGSVRDVPRAAQEVIEELKSTNPEIVVQRKTKFEVTAITDRDLFIQKMLQKGQKLRSETYFEVRESDMPISRSDLKELFKGDYVKLINFAQEVLREMEEMDSSLVADRRRGQVFVKVATNRDLFIKKMQEKGVVLKK